MYSPESLRPASFWTESATDYPTCCSNPTDFNTFSEWEWGWPCAVPIRLIENNPYPKIITIRSFFRFFFP